jgi:O-antigen/teichoic acid export membrane protein
MSNKNISVRHAGLTTSANLAHAIAQWLLLIIVIKQFDDFILGQLVLNLSIISPIFMLFSFKLRSLIVTDYHNTYSFEQYLHARFLSQLFILSFLAALLPILLPQTMLSITLSVIAFKAFDGISELCYSYQHKQQFFSRAAVSQVLRSITTVIVLTTTAYISQDVSFTFYAWALSTGCFALIDIYLVANTLSNVEKRSFKLRGTLISIEAVKISLILYRKYWPVGISIAFGAMFVYIPNYMLEYFHGTKVVGHFATISYFLVAGGIFITSLSQAITPKLSNFYNQGNFSQFIKTTKWLMLIGASIGFIGLVLATLFGEWILTTIYTEVIGQLSQELQLIIIASLIRYSYIFLGAALNALRCFNQQVIVYGSGTVTLTIACLVWVPKYGTLGAANAMIIACVVEFIVMVIIFMKQWRQVSKDKLSII